MVTAGDRLPGGSGMYNFRSDIAGALQHSWWLVLLRGLLAIAFGVFAALNPTVTLAIMVLAFGFYALFDGVITTWTAIAGRKQHDDWWVFLLGGLVGVGIGLLTLTAPRITALVLLFYIAVWSIVHGAIEIVAAIRLRKQIRDEWLLVFAGLISMLFGVVLLARPGTGALAVLWLIAGYAVLFGIILVVLSLRARRFSKELEREVSGFYR